MCSWEIHTSGQYTRCGLISSANEITCKTPEREHDDDRFDTTPELDGCLMHTGGAVKANTKARDVMDDGDSLVTLGGICARFWPM